MSRKKSRIRAAIFTLVGALVGFLYYRFFGCTNGCAITSNPYLTTLYTAFIGWLIAGATQKEDNDSCSILSHFWKE